MLIQIILSLFLGILAGTFTGLIPGIHINLIGAALISFSSTIFFSISPIYLVVFISAMAIAHTFIDFIPSVFLGCPDTDTELSILPGHELLKAGKGHEAIMLTAYGSLAAIIILILIAYPSIIILPKIYELTRDFVPYLLIMIMIGLVSLEKEKFSALFVLLTTGILGLIVLNLELKEPLLPLLTGLFGSSMLITSITDKIKIPKQKIAEKIEINLKRPILGAVFASPLCSFLPGLGSGQAAVIGSTISKTDQKNFLVLIGATNTLVMGFSFLALYCISKTRTGAAIAIQKITGVISPQILILILIVILISGIISFFITKILSKKILSKIEKVNYTKLSLTILILLTIIILLISKFIGFFVLIISTITGIYCMSLKVKKTNMMGCLLLPVIISSLL